MSDLQATTVSGLIEARLAASPNEVGCSIQADGGWRALRWHEIGALLAAARAQLARFGVAPGTALALMAPNSLDWDLAHWAALQLGARVVGLDAGDRPENLNEVIAQTHPTVLVAGSIEALGRLGALPAGLKIVTLLEAAPVRPDGGVAEALCRAVPEGPVAPAVVVRPSDVATTIFTSGTTGKPKGISYTHQQICLAIDNILDGLPELRPGDRTPCWLPQGHLFQRIVNLCAIVRGAHIFYVEKPLELAKLLPSIAPHFIVGVPRFFERVWAGIAEKIASQKPPVRALANWALSVGKRAAKGRREGRPLNAVLRLQLALADRLVLSSIRKALGGEVRFMLSGAAPLPAWLLEEFHGLGLLVLEAYGLSENIVPNCLNTPRAFRFGTVGKPLRGTQVRVDETGEVFVRGDGVFKGYEGSQVNPLDAEGWLATGDLGTLDADGFLTLVGRKSEVVKSSTGRKVPLPAIEAVLRRLPWVELPVVVASGRGAPLAVLYVNLSRLGVASQAPEQTAEQVVRAALPGIRRSLTEVTAELAEYHRPVGVVLVTRAPSLERLELTSNLKVRRGVIDAQFAQALEAVSAAAEQGQWLGELQSMAARV